MKQAAEIEHQLREAAKRMRQVQQSARRQEVLATPEPELVNGAAAGPVVSSPPPASRGQR